MKMIVKAFAAAAIAILGLPAFAASVTLDESAPSWTRWRGPGGNGTLAEAAWNPKSVSSQKILWKVKTGQGYSSVCVVGGYVYTVGMKELDQEMLLCLDADTGAQAWSFEYPSGYTQYPGSRSTPVFEDGKLYIMSLIGHAYCLDARSGGKLWDTDIAALTGALSPTWAFSSSALIEGGLVVFNICKSGVALDKATGKIAWKSGTTASGYATPVPFDFKGKRYLAVLGSQQLTIVEAQTGKEFASVPWVTAYDVNVGDPLVIDDTIFLGTDYGTGCALFRIGDKSLTRIWENKTVFPHFCSAVYRDGFYYVNSGFAGEGMGQFYCLNGKTGQIVWSQDLGVGSMILVGTKLLMTVETGNLVVAEADSKKYTEVARAEKIVPRLCWTAPVLVGGRVYVRSDKGDLVCIDVSK